MELETGTIQYHLWQLVCQSSINNHLLYGTEQICLLLSKQAACFLIRRNWSYRKIVKKETCQFPIISFVLFSAMEFWMHIHLSSLLVQLGWHTCTRSRNCFYCNIGSSVRWRIINCIKSNCYNRHIPRMHAALEM